MAQAQPAFRSGSAAPELDALAKAASRLGYEIVEIAGTLDEVDRDSRVQLTSLEALRDGAARILSSNENVETVAGKVRELAGDAGTTLDTLVSEVRSTAPAMKDLAQWVGALDARVKEVAQMLAEVRKSNSLVTSIASQVNILAINAKIEAARAGDAGRGFAIVAEEVNALSKKTAHAAERISGQVDHLGAWIETLSRESKTFGETANQVHGGAGRTDAAVEEVRARVDATRSDARRIADCAHAVREAGDGFAPAFARIGEGAADNATRIQATRERLNKLIGLSETMVQSTVAAGGVSDDARFIDRVTRDAATLGRLLEEAVASGAITREALFDRNYREIPGTEPRQLLAPFTDLTDRLFPPVQEKALAHDRRVVFCAAVDANGYLPTHNAKFSQPQGRDPVWNAANCRNRRVFDDRVGLKAGRNTEPFLLQVYRRDMGGGQFKMMKDLSAPILVEGRHWGGLRLAYTF